jgi:hypothetical protein
MCTTDESVLLPSFFSNFRRGMIFLHFPVAYHDDVSSHGCITTTEVNCDTLGPDSPYAMERRRSILYILIAGERFYFCCIAAVLLIQEKYNTIHIMKVSQLFFILHITH